MEPISPKTKIGDLLDTFPQLEAVLISMSPAFAKLRNPVLRKTVARVATIQQIAAVGGLNVEDIINRLRSETGQTGSEESTENNYLSDKKPDWFNEKRITLKYDASPLINSGGSPMNEILSKSHNLKPGEILELTSPFVPAPIIDMLKSKGYKVFSVAEHSIVISYISR
jgi:hypothetical protein